MKSARKDPLTLEKTLIFLFKLAATDGRVITPYHQKGGNMYLYLEYQSALPADIGGGVTGMGRI